MARTVLTVQETIRGAGLTPSYVAGDQPNGHSFDNSSHRVFLQVKNTNAATRDVTIATPGTVDGNAVADLVVVVPATSGDKMIGPFRGDTYDQLDSDSGEAQSVFVDLEASAGVTIAAIELGEINF